MNLDRDAVFAKVVKLAAEQVSADAKHVSATTNFTADLNYDSLNQVEFVMELEDAFDISIADEQADGVRTVGQAVDLVWAVLTAQSAQPLEQHSARR